MNHYGLNPHRTFGNLQDGSDDSGAVSSVVTSPRSLRFRRATPCSRYYESGSRSPPSGLRWLNMRPATTFSGEILPFSSGPGDSALEEDICSLAVPRLDNPVGLAHRFLCSLERAELYLFRIPPESSKSASTLRPQRTFKGPKFSSKSHRHARVISSRPFRSSL